MPAPEFSVVVITYNRAAMLALCLDALCDQEEAPPHEIVVIDDGSTDGTADLFQLQHPAVRHCWAPNAGRSAARNRGIAEARGRWLVFVDSDVLVAPGFLRGHAEALVTGGDKVFSQGLSVDVPGPVPPRNPGVPVRDPSRAFFDTKNVGIRTEALRQAGGFDPAFTEYGWEDLELGLRLRDAGWQKLRAPRAIGFHVHPAYRPEDLPRWIETEAQRGRMAAVFLQRRPTWEVRLMTGMTPLHRALEWLLTGGDRWPDAAWPWLRDWCARHPHVAQHLLPGLLAPHGFRETRRLLQAGRHNS
ncbi:MAG: glycosyltransferase [Candidatus Sericytochromatia bacterium]|nr:glycosyltransferase [Candidatus Sericytochromatia bacterium]